jgi:hypothetical protein
MHSWQIMADKRKVEIFSTAGKPGGNGENKRQPTTLGGAGLLSNL